MVGKPNNKLRFVETALFVKFLTATRLELSASDAPRVATWVISTFIKAELRRGLIQYTIFLYDLFRDYESFGDVLDRISRLRPVSFQKRRHDTIQDVIIHLERRVAEDNPVFSEVERYRFMKNTLWLLIMEFIVKKDLFEAVNETNCSVGLSDPLYLPVSDSFDNTAGEDICKKGKGLCNITKFAKNHSSEIELIVRELKNNKGLKEQDKAMAEILENNLRDLGNVPGPDFCKKCGDAIIVCEAPKTHKILHHDHVFERIGPAIGKNEEYIRISEI